MCLRIQVYIKNIKFAFQINKLEIKRIKFVFQIFVSSVVHATNYHRNKTRAQVLSFAVITSILNACLYLNILPRAILWLIVVTGYQITLSNATNENK